MEKLWGDNFFDPATKKWTNKVGGRCCERGLALCAAHWLCRLSRAEPRGGWWLASTRPMGPHPRLG